MYIYLNVAYCFNLGKAFLLEQTKLTWRERMSEKKEERRDDNRRHGYRNKMKALMGVKEGSSEGESNRQWEM